MISERLRELILTEIRLLSRNSRIKAMISGGVLVLPIFLIFSFEGLIEFSKVSAFVAPALYVFFSFISSIFAITIGIHTINWESSYSNLIFTLPILQNEIFITRYYTLIVLNLLGSLYYSIIISFLDLNYSIIFLSLSTFLFNSGISTLIVMRASISNRLFIDLYKTSFLNYEITTVNSFFIPLLINIISYSLYLAFFLVFENQQYVLLAMGSLGFICLIFSTPILRFIYRKLSIEKYQIIEAFEKQNEQ